jgi:hypothetical protein
VPRSCRAALASVLGCLAAVSLTAPSAEAIVPPSGFFGVGGWSYPSNVQAAQLGGAGLRLVRGALGWGTIQTSADPASRNWSDPDRLARNAAADGFSLIFDLNGCSVWACGTVNAPPTGAMLVAYEGFVRAAVARYAPKSSFWDGRRRVPTVSWQVWNEVNGGYFWPDPTPAAYAVFLRQISATIKSSDPQAIVVMSGLDEFPGESSGMTLTRFLSGLYKQPGFASSIDAVAVHGYASDPAESEHILDETRRIMLRNHDGARPVWVTEMSWASAGPASPFTVDAATQNAYLVSAWDTMLACRQRWNLKHVLWFALQDFNGVALGEPDYWGFNNGLLTLDGSPKPSYASFLRFIGSSPLPDGGGNSCPLPGGATVLTTTPATTILSTPGDTNNTRRAIVTFRSNESAAHFQCSLDGGRWLACRSPFNAGSAREGQHEIRVRAIDSQGNVDPTPASATWLVDLTPPDTVITTRRPYRLRGGRLTISFVGSDAVGIRSFQCRVGRARWKACRSPYTTPILRPGRHTVAVRARDRAGNIDRSPARATVVVAR